MQLLKKIKNYLIKPVLYRLFIFPFIFFSISNIFINASVIDSINAGYSFKRIDFFFTKEISDTFNNEIGRILGNVIYSQDSIISYVNTREVSQHLKYSDDSMYTVYEGSKKVVNEKMINIPPELNVMKQINPLYKLKFDSLVVRKDSIIIRGLDNNMLSEIDISFDEEFRITGIIMKKGEKVIMRTEYSMFRDFFPQSIITIDYLSGIKEEIYHYNVIIDKNNI